MRKLVAVVAGFILGVSILLVPSVASAGGICTAYNPVTGECIVEITVPGGGTGTEPTGGGDTGGGNGGQPPACAWKLVNPQPAPPAGKAVTDGAWYESCPITDPRNPTGGGFAVTRWFDSAPPGAGITPGQAAAAVAARLQFRAFQIGMAPEVNPEWGHRRTHVGVPVWMWVADRGPNTYDGYSVSDSAGGVAVSGTIRVTSIRWDMGDGNSVTCGNPGTEYQTGFGVTASPTCGYKYTQTSASRPGDRYQVTATSQWVFDWSAAGQTGTIPLTTSSTTELEVNEMQSVNK